MTCTQTESLFPRLVMEADVCLIQCLPSTTSNENVNIREFEDSVINPDPVIRNEDTEQLMEDYLSPQKLKSLTGIQDLHEVVFLEMRVNTMQNSLGNFGSMVSNLKQLKLSNSVIASVRDLGTSLNNLQTLWMAKCGLADLDGISSLCSIKELYLAYNDITEVSPLTMLDNLQVLDLEGNLVDDVAQVEFLVLCPELKRLTLEGNPVCMKPRPQCSPETQLDYNYRTEVHKALPKLKYLDDEPFLYDLVDGTKVLKITPSQQQNDSLKEKLKSDWELVTERIKAFDLNETETATQNNERPATSHGNRPMTASRQRPSSSKRRPSSARQRPGTASGERPESGGMTRPSTAIGERGSYEEDDDSSDLTHGSAAVICGNPSRALKSRRKNMTEESIVQPNMVFCKEDENHVVDLSQRDLFEELKAWRREYARFLDNCPETTIVEADEDDLDEQHRESNHTSPSPCTPSSLSPTPPQHPVSNLSSARRRVPTHIRKSYPLPAPPENSERPRTAPSFRYRQRSTEGRQRTQVTRTMDISGEMTEPRANSAPVKTSSPRSPSAAPDVAYDIDNPIISASKELKKPKVDPKLLRRVRPSTARPAAPGGNELR